MSSTADDETLPSSFSVDTPTNEQNCESLDYPSTNETDTTVVNCPKDLDTPCHEDNSNLVTPQLEDNLHVVDRKTDLKEKNEEILENETDLSFSDLPPPTPPHSAQPPNDVENMGNRGTSPTKKNVKEMKSTVKSSYPRQSTITSLFAKPRPSTDSTPQPASTESVELSNSQPPLSNPQLSSLDDFLFEKDDKLTVEVSVKPERDLTPLERFQQRLDKHLVVPHPSSKVKVEKGQALLERSKEEDCSMTPLVPEELAAKLVDQPGEYKYYIHVITVLLVYNDMRII